MRLTLITAALLLANPTAADTLPQGRFMLGSYIWPEGAIPYNATLQIEGAGIAISLSSARALNLSECDATGDCIYTLPIATAQGSSDSLSLTLSDVALMPTPESLWSDSMPTSVYADQLISALHDTAILTEDHGFSVLSSFGPLHFYNVDTGGQEAINAYPLHMEMSRRDLAHCDVRQIAPLFTRSDLSPGEVAFRDALRGMAYRWALSAKIDTLVPLYDTLGPAVLEETDALAQAALLPVLLALEPEGPTVIEQFWEGPGRARLDDQRPAYDAMVAQYGGTLVPLADFLRHLAQNDAPRRVQPPCDDLSFGYIAARNGG
ncbi:hypothetical protein [Gymnodinialimonas sp.]